MSRILQAGETGFGILIEQDAGYVSSDLNKKLLAENIAFKPTEPIFINCILQKWGVENKNGRIYPEDVLVPQVNEYQKLIDSNSAVSEADHPESSIISLQNISHKIIKMWWGSGDDSNVLYGKIQLLVTRGYLEMGIVSVVGDKILLYLENGILMGISSRGVGSLEEINGKNIVQDDFELIGFDLVATPSTPGAYLFPEKKNTESSMGENFIKKNGIYIREEKSKIIKTLDNFLN